jgi:glycosyltransferase involved in cell wall biosynthesis
MSHALRLGLPWRMQHYVPLNGPHPLVASFLQGNRVVEAVELAGGAPAPAEALKRVLLNLTQQARRITPAETQKLIEWLNVPEQLSLEAQAERCDALFLHTTPLYAGGSPWLFHFESLASLFMPFMFTGQTRGIDLPRTGFFELVREQLAAPHCVRIFSHLRGSVEMLRRCFADETIAAKLHHVPLGIAPIDPARWQAKFAPGRPLRILFTNSLHQAPRSFYLRGGHHLLEAFGRLRRRHPEARLTVLSSVPPDFAQRFTAQDLEGVHWISQRIDDAALEQLYLEHQLFALPAAGLHSYSLLRALASGCVPIVSDAPGYEEYTAGIEASVFTLRGVREQVYRDEPGGWQSDDYAPFVARSEEFVEQLHGMLRDAADPARLAAAALHNAAHCARQFGLRASQDRFNAMLKG